MLCLSLRTPGRNAHPDSWILAPGSFFYFPAPLFSATIRLFENSPQSPQERVLVPGKSEPTTTMSEAQTESRPEVSLLQQAVNVFLKDAMPHLTLAACADSMIRSVARFIPGGFVSGSLWGPGQRPNTRFRLAVEGDTIVHRESAELDLLREELKLPDASEDDVHILLHRSLKTLTTDRPGLDNLQQGKYRAAIEIRLCYFGRLILLLIVGLPTAKGLINKESEEFLNLFCRCCLITLQGAYIAEMEERSGRSSGLLLHEKFNLTFHWFHSITRHLNLGIAKLRSGQYPEAADALDRTSVVAAVCLAEIITLEKTISGQSPPVASSAPGTT